MTLQKKGSKRAQLPEEGGLQITTGPALPGGYPFPTSKAASAVMRGNKKVDTRPELAVRRRLHALGLRYRVNHLLTLPELKVRPDVVFLRVRVAVFVDGCFWHGCPAHGTKPRSNATYWYSKILRNQERDQRIDAVLRANGWQVIRAWEHEDPNAVSKMIAYAVEAKRSARGTGV
jgi:DNA mismatch endonuclease, patch repair protein